MEITLHSLEKFYNKDCIFQKLDYKISTNSRLAIVGGNGSGKSTLLQIIGSFIYPSAGSIIYTYQGRTLSREQLFSFFSFASPYMDLIEEFTLKELTLFHEKFKPFIQKFSAQEIIEILQLEKHKNKPLSAFSSGMKQRVKLGLAILSDTPLVLLDEPVSNFDAEATNWYKNLLTKFGNNRTIIIASNHNEDELFFCNEVLDIQKYKP